MRLLILHRAILRELVATFLFAVIGFMSVVLMVFVFQLSQKGMPVTYLLKFLPCLVAPVAIYALPMGCLFATTLTYSRLAADQEVQAVQWSGVRLWTCAAPAILVGALTSLGCALLNDQAVPAANARFRALQEEAARELPLVLAATSEPIYGTPTQKIYISAFQGNIFSGVTVMETTNSITTRILNAREAVVNYDRERKAMEFDLQDGSLEVFDPGPPPRVTDQAVFERYPLRIAFDPGIEIWKDWKAATQEEIREALRRRLSGGDVETGEATYAGPDQTLYLGGYRGGAATDVVLVETRPDGTHHVVRSAGAVVEIDLEQARLNLRLGPGKDQRVYQLIAPRRVMEESPFQAMSVSLPLDPQQLGLEGGLHPTTEKVREILKARVLEAQRVWYEARVELQERMSSALAALCFTAVGVPLGVWLRHGNRLVSFGVSLLTVFCLYVPALAAGKALSLSGRLPAPVGLWMPDAVMLAAGLIFGKMIRY